MVSYIALLRKDENSDYGVEFPDLPGCISAGSTLEEAREMAREALAAHVAFLREDGDDIPIPSPLDAIAKQAEIKGAVPFMVELKEPEEKTLRINITVPAGVLNLIDKAAVPMGGNRSAFMVAAAEEKARELTQSPVNVKTWRIVGTGPKEASTPGVRITAKAIRKFKIPRRAGGAILHKQKRSAMKKTVR